MLTILSAENKSKKFFNDNWKIIAKVCYFLIIDKTDTIIGTYVFGKILVL